MKSPSQTQSTSIHPETLSNSSMLLALAGNADPPVLPGTMTNTSPESEAVRKRRTLRMIVDSAIALLDFEDFHPTAKGI
jgi:hypothetical protein